MTDKERKVSYSFYIGVDKLEALRRLSSDTDIPISVWIRRGIDAVLDDALTSDDGE